MGKNGGARPGAGRKPKADEIELIEKLSPLDDSAFEALKAGVAKKEFPYVKLYFEYRFGKPKQNIDHTNDGGAFAEPPAIIIHNVGPELVDTEDKIEA